MTAFLSKLPFSRGILTSNLSAKHTRHRAFNGARERTNERTQHIATSSRVYTRFKALSLSHHLSISRARILCVCFFFVRYFSSISCDLLLLLIPLPGSCSRILGLRFVVVRECRARTSLFHRFSRCIRIVCFSLVAVTVVVRLSPFANLL